MEAIKDTLPKDDEHLMAKIMPIYNKGQYNRVTYKGIWTEDELEKSVSEFFQYCNTVELKPSKPALRVWLAISAEQYNQWEKDKEKFGFKTDIIRLANSMMEMYLVGRVDKYPTGNIFLLKSSFGHKDSTNIDVTSHNASQDDIQEALKRLGLVEKDTD